MKKNNAVDIFLSHRHNDKPIADIIRKHLNKWGFDNKIFQSSSPGHGIAPGAAIKGNIKEALHQAKLLILIYTQADEDWSYCIWECGLATDLNDEKNRVIVFQFSDNIPKFFEDEEVVKINELGVKDFVVNLFTKEGFFPGQPAFKPDISSETLETYFDEFYQDLKTIKIPGKTPLVLSSSQTLKKLEGAVKKTDIFLSHRHDDKPIADIIRRHLNKWGFDNKIFQSSSPGHGVVPGGQIKEDIKEALRQVKLLILVYTQTDEDWSYCIWECGLATDLNDRKNRVIVFQFPHNKTPKPFEDEEVVKIDESGVKDFVINFFTKEGFFLGQPAFKPDISNETLETYFDEFYQELKSVKIPGETKKRFRWDFFTLEMKPDDLAKIKEKSEKEIDEHELASLCKVTGHFGEALKHFGYNSMEENMTLTDLINRWKKKTDDRQDINSEWIIEIKSELLSAIENSPASPEWKYFNSVRYPKTWYYPVVQLVRLKSDGSMEFIIYCYRNPPQATK